MAENTSKGATFLVFAAFFNTETLLSTIAESEEEEEGVGEEDDDEDSNASVSVLSWAEQTMRWLTGMLP